MNVWGLEEGKIKLILVEIFIYEVRERIYGYRGGRSVSWNDLRVVYVWVKYCFLWLRFGEVGF